MRFLLRLRFLGKVTDATTSAYNVYSSFNFHILATEYETRHTILNQ
jgi:hypothetical protein